MSEKLLGIASVVIAAGSVVLMLLIVTGATVLWKYCKKRYECCRKLEKWNKRNQNQSELKKCDEKQRQTILSAPTPTPAAIRNADINEFSRSVTTNTLDKEPTKYISVKIEETANNAEKVMRQEKAIEVPAMVKKQFDDEKSLSKSSCNSLQMSKQLACSSSYLKSTGASPGFPKSSSVIGSIAPRDFNNSTSKPPSYEVKAEGNDQQQQQQQPDVRDRSRNRPSRKSLTRARSTTLSEHHKGSGDPPYQNMRALLRDCVIREDLENDRRTRVLPRRNQSSVSINGAVDHVREIGPEDDQRHSDNMRGAIGFSMDAGSVSDFDADADADLGRPLLESASASASAPRHTDAYIYSVEEHEEHLESRDSLLKQQKYLAMWMHRPADAVDQERKFAELWRRRWQPGAIESDRERERDRLHQQMQLQMCSRLAELTGTHGHDDSFELPDDVPVPLPISASKFGGAIVAPIAGRGRIDCGYRGAIEDGDQSRFVVGMEGSLGLGSRSGTGSASGTSTPARSAVNRWMKHKQRDLMEKSRPEAQSIGGFQHLVTEALDHERRRKRQLPVLPSSGSNAASSSGSSITLQSINRSYTTSAYDYL